MSDEWQSLTHRFEVGGHKGYVTAAVGLDGRPLLVEIRMAKAGGPLRGLLEALGAAITVGLQHGVPLGAYAARLAHASFEPSGWTGGELGHARSVVDYVARWLALRFPDPEPAGLPGEAFEGETCRVCGLPATWDLGSPCPECGDIAPPAGGASGRAATRPGAGRKSPAVARRSGTLGRPPSRPPRSSAGPIPAQAGENPALSMARRREALSATNPGRAAAPAGSRSPFPARR